MIVKRVLLRSSKRWWAVIDATTVNSFMKSLQYAYIKYSLFFKESYEMLLQEIV